VTSGTERVKNTIVEEVLGNGLRVLLAPDPESPIAVARMIFPVGSAADPPDRRGLATVAGLMLGHENRQYPLSQANVLSWVLGLGASMDAEVAERVTTFEVRGLAMHADWHVWRLFWLLDLGHYDGKQLSRLQKGFEDDDDPDVRGHALRDALFGAAHPYSAPRMTAADLKKIGTGDLGRFRASHYKARGATLIVTGGFDVDAMRAEIIEFFGAWGGEAPPPEVAVPAIMPADGPTWIGVREDTGSQPHLTIAFATTSSPNQDRAARLILIEMVEDRARVVRESLGATYGVSVQYSAGAGGAKLQLDAALDPVKAGKAMRALLDEIATLRDRTGELPEDFVRARRRALADALGDSAGAFDLAAELTAVVHNGLPLDYFAKLAGEIGGTTLDDVAALAARDLAEQRMVVVLSGRGPVIDDAFEAAGITPKMLDGD
jgi:zinc protease